jgi:cyclic pyranopterin phosphate synthase
MGEEGDDSPWASLDAFADTIGAVDEPNGGTQTSKRPPIDESVVARTPTPSAGVEKKHSLDQFEIAAAAAAEAYASSRLHKKTITSSDSQPHQPRLTHLDARNNDRASMVDISDKKPSPRSACATCRVYIPRTILPLLASSSSADDAVSVSSPSFRAKGPVLHTAQLAGIMAAKRTSELIPLCHGLHLSHVDVVLDVIEGGGLDSAVESFISVQCIASTTSGTGVEMEALTGASVASLTLWDMLKSVGGKEMRIDGLMVTRKSGGKSGDFVRQSL